MEMMGVMEHENMETITPKEQLELQCTENEQPKRIAEALRILRTNSINFNYF